MNTYDELSCRKSENAIKEMVEQTIYILRTRYGLNPDILLRWVETVVKEVLQDDFDIYEVTCREIVARRVREYLNKFHGGTLPPPPTKPKTDWTRIGAIAAISTILLTIILFILERIW